MASSAHSGPGAAGNRASDEIAFCVGGDGRAKALWLLEGPTPGLQGGMMDYWGPHADAGARRDRRMRTFVGSLESQVAALEAVDDRHGLARLLGGGTSLWLEPAQSQRTLLDAICACARLIVHARPHMIHLMSETVRVRSA